MRVNFAALGAFALACGLLSFWLTRDWQSLAPAAGGLLLVVVHPIRARRFKEYDERRRETLRAFSDENEPS